MLLGGNIYTCYLADLYKKIAQYKKYFVKVRWNHSQPKSKNNQIFICVRHIVAGVSILCRKVSAANNHKTVPLSRGVV